MLPEDAEDRTEEPTQRRLEEAREKGQIFRSKEWSHLICILGSAVLFGSFFESLVFRLQAISRYFWSMIGYKPTGGSSFSLFIFEHLSKGFQEAIIGISIFSGSLFVLNLLLNPVIGGLYFSSEALLPKFSRLNPIDGLSRILSKKSLIGLLKSIFKMIILILFLIFILYTFKFKVISLSQKETSFGILAAMNLVFKAFVFFSAAVACIAFFDVLTGFFEHKKSIKMTKQEVRDEYKNTEGKPEIKQKIRRIQMSASRKRMMKQVPKATVVLRNPTHYAVALYYEQSLTAAPIVLAKGKDLIAETIMSVAAEHDIPILRAPRLARILYRYVGLDQPIPMGLYVAVAKVLGYVFELKRFKEGRSQEPILTDDWNIPEDFKDIV